MSRTDSDSVFRLVEGDDKRETFIPLRHTDLAKLLKISQGISGEDEVCYDKLHARLQSIFHAEHLTALLAIENLYSPLDPDCELIKAAELDPNKIAQRTESVFRQFGRLLLAAHYQRVPRDELLRAIQLSSQWGIKLDVDFEVFDQLEVFARGYRLVTAERRRWQNFYRRETIELPEFHRLLLAFRVKDDVTTSRDLKTDVVYLKMFKNIPETDLEILLPGTRVKLSPLDRGKILLPTISGAAPTIYRMYRGILVIGLAATLANFWGMLFVVAAFIGYIAKSILTYFRTKDKYQFELTRNLYVKNLDNNAGVLYRILNEARDQELCETILSYTMLWTSDTKPGLPAEAVDDLAEEFIRNKTGQDVNFEVHDAVEKLERLGLAQQVGDGLWRATDIDSATSSLNESWNRLFKSRLAASHHSGVDADETDLDQNLFTSR